MTQLLKSISKITGLINERAGIFASWLTTVLVILICFDVLMRYFFNTTKIWIFEVEWHLYALVFLLGAGFAFKHDRHVRVDLFYAKFSGKGKAWVNLIGTFLFLIPWCVIVIIASNKYAHTSFNIGESSPDPGGLPARYLIKYAITVGVGLLFLQALGMLSDALLILMRKKESLEKTD